MIPAWDNGELKPIEKLEVHRRALKHKAVSVFVIAGSETLIQKRALGKYHTPGLWANACCTHPYWEENPADCVIRRLEEELGISTPIDFVYCDQIEYRANVGKGLTEHEIVDVFTLTIETKQQIEIILNTAEVMATRWVNFEILKQEIKKTSESFTPWLKIYLTDHSEQILKK